MGALWPIFYSPLQQTRKTCRTSLKRPPVLQPSKRSAVIRLATNQVCRPRYPWVEKAAKKPRPWRPRFAEHSAAHAGYCALAIPLRTRHYLRRPAELLRVLEIRDHAHLATSKHSVLSVAEPPLPSLLPHPSSPPSSTRTAPPSPPWPSPPPLAPRPPARAQTPWPSPAPDSSPASHPRRRPRRPHTPRRTAPQTPARDTP